MSHDILLNQPKVPLMTDPLGAHWDAPKLDTLTFSLSHVFMTTSQFNMLSNYQSTNPSGVYAGKMWKRRDPRGRWYLLYYYPLKDPKWFNIGRFRIQII